MQWLIPSITAMLVGTIILAMLYGYIYKVYHERFIGIWAFSWLMYALKSFFELLIQYSGDSVAVLIGHQIANLLSGILILWGTLAFKDRAMPKWLLYAVILDVIWIFAGVSVQVSWDLLNIPTVLFISLIYIWSGFVFLRSNEVAGLGKLLTGWGFVLWGFHKWDYPIFSTLPNYAWVGYVLATAFELSVAIGTLLMYFERMRMVLGSSVERFRLLAENAQDLIYRYRFTPVRGFEYVSPSSTLITSYTPEEHYADPDIVFKIVHPDDRHLLNDINLLVGVKREPFSLRSARKDGKMIWTEHRNVPIFDAKGNIVGFEGIARDISERKKAEEVLKRYQHLTEHARDVILFFNREGRIIEANDAAINSYGYKREQLLKMNIYDLLADDNRLLLAEQMRQAETEGILFEALHRRKDNSLLPVEVNLQGTFLDDEFVLFCIVRDITERKRAEETINYLAYHDPLTELPNRVLFYDRLTTALLNSQRNRKMLAVMFLDLDRFKLVNDVMGHAVGDKLLKLVAQELTGCVRANDIVARIGGDEFTILLPEIGREEDATKVAQKIIDALKKPWVLEGQEFHITTSIGIVLFPNDGEDAETLTKNADTAMYRAKEQGDNYQFYTPTMNQKAVKRMEIERFMRKALELNEYEVYYQPQVNIKTGLIVGMEALLRWHHPEQGLIQPKDFISVAEDTGLIVPLGEWVLRTACVQNMVWQNAGLPPKGISVNISASQFRQKQLVDTVAKVLREIGMKPELLELELTESTAMKDVEFTIEIMRKLREMGVRIAMDDFGTGYSSLGYLRRFPITTLKVDRSFVRDVLTDVEDAAIVATIIVLGQNLKLKIIVEGVETIEQLRFFEQQECFVMQGYLFSKPTTAAEAEQLHRLVIEKSVKLR